MLLLQTVGDADRVKVGQVHVQDQHLRRGLDRQALHLPPVAGFSHDADVRLLVEHAHNTGPHNRVVVGDQDPYRPGVVHSAGSLASMKLNRCQEG